MGEGESGVGKRSNTGQEGSLHWSPSNGAPKRTNFNFRRTHGPTPDPDPEGGGGSSTVRPPPPPL